MASELLGSNLFSSVYKATSESIKAKGHVSGDPWDLVMPRLGALCGVQLEPSQAIIPMISAGLALKRPRLPVRRTRASNSV